MVEFFSTEISAMVCRVRSCNATGCRVMMSARLAELDGGLILAFRRDDLGAAVTFRFSFTRHCTLHVLRQMDVLDLNGGHLCAPWLGVVVNHVFDLLVDTGGIRPQLIEAEPPNNGPRSYCFGTRSEISRQNKASAATIAMKPMQPP